MLIFNWRDFSRNYISIWHLWRMWLGIYQPKQELHIYFRIIYVGFNQQIYAYNRYTYICMILPQNKIQSLGCCFGGKNCGFWPIKTVCLTEKMGSCPEMMSNDHQFWRSTFVFLKQPYVLKVSYENMILFPNSIDKSSYSRYNVDISYKHTRLQVYIIYICIDTIYIDTIYIYIETLYVYIYTHYVYIYI